MLIIVLKEGVNHSVMAIEAPQEAVSRSVAVVIEAPQEGEASREALLGEVVAEEAISNQEVEILEAVDHPLGVEAEDLADDEIGNKVILILTQT